MVLAASLWFGEGVVKTVVEFLRCP